MTDPNKLVLPPEEHLVLLAMPESGELFITANSQRIEYFTHVSYEPELSRYIAEEEAHEIIQKGLFVWHNAEFGTTADMEAHRQRHAGIFLESRHPSIAVDPNTWDEDRMRRA